MPGRVKLNPSALRFSVRRTKLAAPVSDGKKTDCACVTRPRASSSCSTATVTAGVVVDAAVTASRRESGTGVAGGRGSAVSAGDVVARG